jgi:hypothetical protein
MRPATARHVFTQYQFLLDFANATITPKNYLDLALKCRPADPKASLMIAGYLIEEECSDQSVMFLRPPRNCETRPRLLS